MWEKRTKNMARLETGEGLVGLVYLVYLPRVSRVSRCLSRCLCVADSCPSCAASFECVSVCHWFCARPA